MDDHHSLRSQWLGAVNDAAIAADLERIYADTAVAIARRGPACWASGRCCNFVKADHLLYVTGLEAAYTVSRLDGPVRAGAVEEAVGRGDCPFLSGNLCGVHGIKPLACRTFFCDRSATGWQQELSEQMHERVRGLHARHGLTYLYAEWRWHLRLLCG